MEREVELHIEGYTPIGVIGIDVSLAMAWREWHIKQVNGDYYVRLVGRTLEAGTSSVTATILYVSNNMIAADQSTS